MLYRSFFLIQEYFRIICTLLLFFRNNPFACNRYFVECLFGLPYQHCSSSQKAFVQNGALGIEACPWRAVRGLLLVGCDYVSICTRVLCGPRFLADSHVGHPH